MRIVTRCGLRRAPEWRTATPVPIRSPILGMCGRHPPFVEGRHAPVLMDPRRRHTTNQKDRRRKSVRAAERTKHSKRNRKSAARADSHRAVPVALPQVPAGEGRCAGKVFERKQQKHGWANRHYRAKPKNVDGLVFLSKSTNKRGWACRP